MTAPTTSKLIERLTDPNYAGELQHLRSWSEIDRLHSLAASRLADLERDYNMLSAEYADLKAFDTEEMGALLSRATTAERSLARAEEVIEPFARYALGDDADMIPDECVISLTYDSTDFDEELGGPNTLLGEPFMRVFRLARDFLNRSKDTGGEHG